MSLVFRLVILALLLVANLNVESAAKEQRVALVVGNNRYDYVPRLQAAVNDARAMAVTLRELGFEVLVAEDQSRNSMSEAISLLENKLAAGDTAFFFFAGHGFEIRGENFLLPTDVPDATEGQEELVRDASFAVDRIIERLQSRSPRAIILVLDACRNNPFPQKGKRGLRGGGGLAPMRPAEGVFVLYSAGAKQTALDTLGSNDLTDNSVFTRIFTSELLSPDSTLVEIAKRTQVRVRDMAATVRHEQTPAYYDQVVGDIVLAGATKYSGSANSSLPSSPPLQLAKAREPSRVESPPIAQFSRGISSWQANFSFPSRPRAISWRIGNVGEFKETGFLDVLDPDTGRRMPNPIVNFPADTSATTIFVQYLDGEGILRGPVPILFDPHTALVRQHRKALEMTPGYWLALKEDRLYFSHLIQYRCAIRRAKIGIDTSIPDQSLPLPPCNDGKPVVVEANPVRVPVNAKQVSAELMYEDGSISEIRMFYRE